MKKSINAATFGGVLASGFLVVSAPVAHASPCGPMNGPSHQVSLACQECQVAANGNTAPAPQCWDPVETSAAPSRNTPPPSRVPVLTPLAPGPTRPRAWRGCRPQRSFRLRRPSTIPVQTPKINPPAPGAPRNASLVAPPKALDAPPQAVAAAKAAPATRINPATPPKPPTQVDFNHQVQNVVNAHSGNVDVVKAGNQALVRPRHWDYLDYENDYHRPSLYNPLNQAMTFRYFYDGADREAYVPAGGRIVLDVATVGLFPFTAVGDSYVASGSFYGGASIPPDGWDGPPPPNYTPPAPPEAYHYVSAYVPADNQTVEVGQVEVVGHDDSQPAGNQDTFLLDDSTLAWGQVNDPGSSAQITVTKTQSLPGVGPTDNGSFLVALAAQQQPAHDWKYNWNAALVVLAGGVLTGMATWTIIKRQRGARPA